MNNNKSGEKLEEVKKAWDEAITSQDADLEKRLRIIYNFLQSLAHPEKFTQIEKEDFRRLAQELAFDEHTDVHEWLSSQRRRS